MVVLVTGGAGFVGVNIVRRLALDGHTVVCLSLPGQGPDPARDRFLQSVRHRVVLVAGDVGQPTSLEAVWSRHRPSHVVHAAAITPTAEMERAMTHRIVTTNLMGTVNILEAARRGQAQRVVYLSSAAVYGTTEEDVLITEDAPLRAWGLYAITKETSEKLAAYTQELHGLQTVSLRVGWVYGPMERPMPASRLSMSLIYHLTALAQDGQEIRVAHLDHVRDWIHADDLARAVEQVLGRPHLSHPVYNLSGGRGYTHRDVLEALGQVLPLRYRQVAVPEEANVSPAQTRKRRGPMSIHRLIADTGFRPTIALVDGLRDYVGWVTGERKQDAGALQ